MIRASQCNPVDAMPQVPIPAGYCSISASVGSGNSAPENGPEMSCGKNCLPMSTAASYVGEFPLVLECSVTAVHELGLHTQFIGEIRDAKIDEELIGDDGHVDVDRLGPVLFAMNPGSYYGIGELIGKAYSIGKDLGEAPFSDGSADAH